MSNEPQTEEQNKIFAILKQWAIHGLWYQILCSIVALILFFPIFYHVTLHFGKGALVGAIIGCTVGLTVGQFTTWVARKHFLCRLTKEERELIYTLSAEKAASYGSVIKSFRRTLRKIPSPNELLRASSPTPDDGTLLRAATPSHDIPQEELLRASYTSEP